MAGLDPAIHDFKRAAAPRFINFSNKLNLNLIVYASFGGWVICSNFLT